MYGGNGTAGECVQQLRKDRRFEEEVAVHDKEVVAPDKSCGGAYGVGRAELLPLFDIGDSASEPAAVGKMAAYPALSMADNDADVGDARGGDAFDAPLQ